MLLLWVMSIAPTVATAQRRDTTVKIPANAAQPAVTPACCAIARIDAQASLVTARETATGFTFRFEVKSKRLLATLKIAQPVWADFAAKTVRLKATDASPCCAIVPTPPSGDALGAGSRAEARYRKETS